MNRNELISIVKDEMGNSDLEGFVRTNTGSLVFDRRYKVEMADQVGLSPRNADLNIMGEVIVALTETEMYELLDGSSR